MRRRVFRRVAAVSAVLAGVTGLAANAFLLLYFGLARPWQPGHSGAFEWLGPANDIVGSLSMAATIPVVAYVQRQIPGDRLLAVVSAGAGLACAAFAAAGPLLVAGRISLETQFVVAGLGLPVIFGWLWRAAGTASRTGLLPTGTGRFGEFVGIAALAATVVAAAGLLPPTGSAAQLILLGVAAAPGLPAYLAFPVWEFMAGRAWWRADAEKPMATGEPVHGTSRGIPH